MANKNIEKKNMKISEDMQRRIVDMARLTWDAVGCDLFACIAEAGENIHSISREEVMETVADADRMEMYGNDKEAYEYWSKLPTYKDQLKAIKGAFPFKSYSM